MKNFSSGLTIAAAVVCCWYLLKILAIVAYVLMPFILVAAVLYFLGHGAPKEMHDNVEAQIRKWFDWLSFKAPPWSWGAIKAARNGLDWLGIQVKKAA